MILLQLCNLLSLLMVGLCLAGTLGLLPFLEIHMGTKKSHIATVIGLSIMFLGLLNGAIPIFIK